MESNPSAATATIEPNNNAPSGAPSQTGLDWQLLAVIGAWDSLPDDTKATLHFIATTSRGADA